MADQPPDKGAESRTGMAAERTWLAWWRTALGATAGALAVGRFAPQLLHTSSAPYVALGCLYAVLALALLFVGARRQRDLQRATDGGDVAPLPYAVVAFFTIGGVALALTTIVLLFAS